MGQIGDRAVQLVGSPDEADVRAEPVTDSPAAIWVYAVAAPFPMAQDDLDLQVLTSVWGGVEGDWTRVIVRQEDAAAVRTRLGPSGYTVWEEVREQVAGRTNKFKTQKIILF